MKRKILAIVCIAVVVLMVVSTVPVGAKKPPKPPGGDGGPDATGTIFWHMEDESDVWHIYSMNADGSNKVKLTQKVPGTDALSLQKHGGHYWYIGFVDVDSTNPDGSVHKELFAIRDDNGKTVQLTNDPTMEWHDWNGPPVWLTGDYHISWGAVKWGTDASGADIVVEAGFYKAPFTFGATGNDPALSSAPSLVWSTSVRFHGNYDTYHPNGYYPNWSADMSMIVYGKPNSGINLINLNTMSETLITQGGPAKISPDGTRIAFQRADALRVINLDGTGEKLLTSVKDTNRWQKSIRDYRWSPDSNFICYSETRTSITSTYNAIGDVYVIDADGSGRECLTKGVNSDGWKLSRDWR
jgi:Tol biopolymer transport system component